MFKSSGFVMESCIAWNGGGDDREDLFGVKCHRLGDRSQAQEYNVGFLRLFPVVALEDDELVAEVNFLI